MLRPFELTDREVFRALNADAEVMRYFPRTLNAAESDRLQDRINRCISELGFGFFALEVRDLGFVGFVGCKPSKFEASFNPSIEIAWRLARRAWGKGLATRASRRVLEHMYAHASIQQINAFTSRNNSRSYKVMERLGMKRGEDFEMVSLPEGHPLRTHRYYYLTRAAWEAHEFSRG